jgi:hypothetical protein
MLRCVTLAAARSSARRAAQPFRPAPACFATLTTRETRPLDAPKTWTKTLGEHGWEMQRYTSFPEFHVTLYELTHPKTGATYLHADREDSDNVFSVAFRTPPSDSTGIAHILEHLALCGSKKFPVRDPFFFMLKRSLKTFMNAMTAADYTMYPFSTQNEQDYKNLLSVYLDAAFFPLMLESDFRQEGHRYEFADMKDPTSLLDYKGVVYNEMKGAMSDSHSLFAQALSSHLFHKSTYHHNSGGEPTCIPDLTHAQLKAFHATKYHPSNACFFSYGDLPPPIAEVTSHVLERFTALPEADLVVDIPEPRRAIAAAAQRVSITCPPDPLVPDESKQAKIAVAFMCSKSHTHVEDAAEPTFDVETAGMELYVVREILWRLFGFSALCARKFSRSICNSVSTACQRCCLTDPRRRCTRRLWLRASPLHTRRARASTARRARVCFPSVCKALRMRTQTRCSPSLTRRCAASPSTALSSRASTPSSTRLSCR